MKYPVTAFPSLLLLACVASASAADIVEAPVCDVLADPGAFAGKPIRIKDATVIAGFDEFVVQGADCRPSAAIWLAYPAGTKGKAGPAAFARLQPAKNGALLAEVEKRTVIALQHDKAFAQFDALLATPHKSSTPCLACPRNVVTATLVGRLDVASGRGVVRGSSGKPTGLAGFGNMNLYRTRLVLQSVSDVVSRELDYSAGGKPLRGNSRRLAAASTEQTKRAVAAFGEEGENNGVVVGFGVGNEVPADEGRKGDSDSPDGILFLVSFDMDRLGKQMLPNAIAHMGAHIAEIRAGAGGDPVEDVESRAWQVTFGK